MREMYEGETLKLSVNLPFGLVKFLQLRHENFIFFFIRHRIDSKVFSHVLEMRRLKHCFCRAQFLPAKRQKFCSEENLEGVLNFGSHSARTNHETSPIHTTVPKYTNNFQISSFRLQIIIHKTILCYFPRNPASFAAQKLLQCFVITATVYKLSSAVALSMNRLPQFIV